jgi:histone deacetylase 1/2
MAIRRQLQETKKLELSITTYFNKIKAMSDTLTSIGQPLRPEEFIGYVLDGLDDDYDPLVAVITNRTTPIPVRDLLAQLQSMEQRVEARKAELQGGHGGFSAHSSYRSSKNSFRPDFRSGADQRNPPKPFYTNKPAGGSSGGFQSGAGGGSRGAPQSGGGGGFQSGGGGAFQSGGGARSGGGSGNRPICQICDKAGHIASRCFKRFKQEYLGVDNDGRYMDRQVAAATTHGHGHTSSHSVDPGWYMDTGATDHLTNELDKLTVKENYRGNDQVHAANGNGMQIHHIGHSSLPTPSSQSLHLKGVLHVPSVTRSLLSVRRFTLDNRVFFEFHPHFFFVKDRDTRAILLSGRCYGGLYRLDDSPAKQVFSGIKVSREKWHYRLGHPATPIVQHILHHRQLPSLDLHNNVICDACQQGKSHQLPFSLSTHVVSAPLEIIYSDVWGPAQTSVSGHTYYVSFIDGYSRFTWLYLLKRKNDVFDIFLQFQRHVERLLNRKIIHVQTDWGGEYIKLNQFFSNIGISHRVSCPHTHQQNGTAERKHRHIVETGLTLLAHASVPFRFWSDAFSTACFLINRLPSRVINMQTPLERLLGEAPDYTFFRVFGCACWPHLQSYCLSPIT